MSCGNDHAVAGFYREVLRIGDELADFLAHFPTDDELSHIELLVRKRAAAVDAAASSLSCVGAPAEVLEVVLQTVDQQRLLEERLGRIMAGEGQAVAASQAVRGRVHSIHRLLSFGTRSGVLDERR